jgi:hypothetical protein
MTKPVPVRSDFKIVLLCAFGLVAGCLVFAGIFALMVAQPTPMQQKVIEHCLDLSKIGAGAIFGLLGGRSLRR